MLRMSNHLYSLTTAEKAYLLALRCSDCRRRRLAGADECTEKYCCCSGAAELCETQYRLQRKDQESGADDAHHNRPAGSGSKRVGLCRTRYRSRQRRPVISDLHKRKRSLRFHRNTTAHRSRGNRCLGANWSEADECVLPGGAWFPSNFCSATNAAALKTVCSFTGIASVSPASSSGFTRL